MGGRKAFWSKYVYWPLLVAMIFLACYGPRVDTREFRPTKGQQPITMFGQYELDFFGQADTTSSNFHVTCYVEFIEKVVASTAHETIPIFVIDSFCVAGECLDSSYCAKPISEADWTRAMIKKGRFLSFREPIAPDDLWQGPNRIRPEGYVILEELVDLPLSCTGTDLAVIVTARLIDRVNGEELGRERISIPFAIEKSDRRISMGE